ncbi:flagellar hook-basal body complex protein FliE [Anaerocolumna sedimenticola]|uniref:Flagellar hook-basal body complex protein FliE n=1 Tax=Anaerocolumna sedimenticola TaxID=2696063 RepID=A0A6P1TLH4_9FIRM|nr:flagellar hook-basal body complex protein FliE [Anaerocolumna sedimenticola]QHQ62070.1 flagellar hook-basal body complex protein FliE [Anaerocolumna sedimenticola]
MDIALLNSISDLSTFDRNTATVNKTNKNETFENLFQSALSMVKDTNDLTNTAEKAEMSYALGFNENTHDLQVAQWKANLSLQYTVAVRNKVLESYKEIMNLQF